MVPPGGSHAVALRFTPAAEGYAATFVEVRSDDGDEPELSFPVWSDDNPTILDIGDPAPDFTLPDLDGVPHTLSDYLGRVVVLAFWANW